MTDEERQAQSELFDLLNQMCVDVGLRWQKYTGMSPTLEANVAMAQLLGADDPWLVVTHPEMIHDILANDHDLIPTGFFLDPEHIKRVRAELSIGDPRPDPDDLLVAEEKGEQ